MLCRATQDRWIMVDSSDKTWTTGEGNGKPLQYSCLENSMNSMKRQKDRTLKDELPRSVGTQYAPGYQWRSNSRKNEKMEPKHTRVGCSFLLQGIFLTQGSNLHLLHFWRILYHYSTLETRTWMVYLPSLHCWWGRDGQIEGVDLGYWPPSLSCFLQSSQTHPLSS